MEDTLIIENFKKFTEKKLPLGENALIFEGKSGSGKTQILWAYLIFFWVNNLRFEKKITNENNLNDFSYVLTNADYISSSTLNICVKNGNDNSKFIATVNNVDIRFILNTCGSIFQENENIPLRKILYAHMGSLYEFTSAYERRISITSFNQSLRDKFVSLTKMSKSILSDNIKLLFPDFSSFICYYSGTRMIKLCCEMKKENETFLLEIMLMNSAFQKIFASLILFYTLIESESQSDIERYYLIDNYNTGLDAALARNFITCLIELSLKNNIKLIATTSYNDLMPAETELLPYKVMCLDD